MSETKSLYIRCIGYGSFLLLRAYLNQVYGYPTEKKNSDGTPAVETICRADDARHPDYEFYGNDYFIPISGNGVVDGIMENKDVQECDNVQFWTVEKYLKSVNDYLERTQ